jgi:carbon monoxide dehydrogenase subunit G
VRLAHVTKWIAPPPAAVWAVLTDFARPQRLAPTIMHCDVTGTGVGAVRTVSSSSGATIYERLVECDAAALRFVYEVLDNGDMPFAGVETYCATVTLVARDGGTTVSWQAEGTLSGDAEPVQRYLSGLYHGAIARIAELAAEKI